jgi:hypothetical protein
MSPNTIQKVITVFSEAFSEMGVAISMQNLEEMAVLVHRAMTLQTRHFHTLDHVFSFTTNANPIQTLAALFHDIVYYQVDEGFIPQIKTIIAPYLDLTKNEIAIITPLPKDDRLLQLTLDVFNFFPGQILTTVNGLNEFLSSLVMVKLLQGAVADHDLIKMIVCIEATIPFQGKNDRNETHFDLLATRLNTINVNYNLGLETTEIEEALKLAVTFTNKDVESFSEMDAGIFLDNTWKLLPETNVALRSAEIYSIQEYRQALHKMESFFLTLNPDNVFNQYHGIPPDHEFEQMVWQAHQNVFIARDYLRIKLLAAAVLEALAEISGGDAPLSLFSGEIHGVQEQTLLYESFIIQPLERLPVDHDSPLYKLFYEGRPAVTSFDLRTSPLSLFIFTTLSSSEINRLIILAKGMFSHIVNPLDFLMDFPHPMLAAVARACAHLVLTRRERLLNFADSL